MIKPRDISENNLPLSLIGNEKGTFKQVFELTSLLNSNITLSLKYHGYINQSAILQSGETVDNVWVKQV